MNAKIEDLQNLWISSRDKHDRKAINSDLKRDLQHGWLTPYLIQIDCNTWKRWDYWFEAMSAGMLPDSPMPKVQFLTEGDRRLSAPRRHLEKCLNLIPNYGSWQGWGGSEYFRYLMEWLLYGFGHQGQSELPKEPHGCEGASMRLCQFFDLHSLMLFPHDYWGDILAESAYGRGRGFYPTPHAVCEMMAIMTFQQGEDSRSLKFCDPCVGTGRFPLYASNYSMRLFCQDIDETVILATLCNGFCYAPWLVRPLPFWNDLSSQALDKVSEAVTEAASNPAAEEYLAGTEHDSEEQYRFEPVLKRKKKASQDCEESLQGLLF